MQNPDLASELLKMEEEDLNTRTMLIEKGGSKQSVGIRTVLNKPLTFLKNVSGAS